MSLQEAIAKLFVGESRFRRASGIDREAFLQKGVAAIKLVQDFTLGETLTWDRFIADLKNKQVMFDGNEITLTHKEYMLFIFLLRHPTELHTNTTLVDALWGAGGSDANLRVLIENLRNKLPDGYIWNRPRYGYKLDTPEKMATSNGWKDGENTETTNPIGE